MYTFIRDPFSIVHLSVLFLFTFQLLGILIAHAYGQGLLQLGFSPYTVMLIFLLSPMALVVMPKLTSTRFLTIRDTCCDLLIIAIVLFRFVLTFVPAPYTIVISSFGMACAMVLWATIATDSSKSWQLSESLLWSLLLSMLIRAWFGSMDASLRPTVFGGIVSGGLCSLVLWMRALARRHFRTTHVPLLDPFDNTPSVQQESSAGQDVDDDEEEVVDEHQEVVSILRIALVTMSLVSVVIVDYIAIISPQILARWSEVPYMAVAIISATSVSIHVMLLPWLVHLLEQRQILIRVSLTCVPCVFLVVTAALHRNPHAGGRIACCVLFLLTAVTLHVHAAVAIHRVGRWTSQHFRVRQHFAVWTCMGLWIIVMCLFVIFTIVWPYVSLPFFREKLWFCLMLLSASIIVGSWLCGEAAVDVNGISLPPWSSVVPRAIVCIVAVVIIIVGVVVEAPNTAKNAWGSDANELRVMSYNIQQGYDKTGHPNFEELVNVVKHLRPHVLGVQESDTARIEHFNEDVIAYIASKVNMHAYFGPKSSSGTYGIALLSVYPIRDAETSFMTSKNEQTMYIKSKIELPNGSVLNMFVTHLGDGVQDIRTQSEEISAAVEEAGSTNSIMVCDCNFTPNTTDHSIVSQVLVDTYAAVTPNPDGVTCDGERIDFIWASSDFHILDSTIESWTHASDHFPIMARFKL